MSKSHKKHRRTTVAIVFGTEGEPIAVLCDPDGDPPGQRWFSPDSEPDVHVCVDCLLGQHPRLGKGLDVALEPRGAEWLEGEWVPAPELWDE